MTKQQVSCIKRRESADQAKRVQFVFNEQSYFIRPRINT